MISQNRNLLWLCLVTLFLSLNAKQAKADSLMDAIALALINQTPNTFAAFNRAAAEKYAIEEVKRRKRIALEISHAYLDLQYAERMQIIADGFYHFASKLALKEVQHFDEGLSTRTNVNLTKAYQYQAENYRLEAQREKEHAQAKMLIFTGKHFGGKTSTFTLGRELASQKHVRDGISLSHPVLMQHAFQVKNLRITKGRKKLKKNKEKIYDERIDAGERGFEEALNLLSQKAMLHYKDHQWATKKLANYKKQIKVTKNAFDAALEEHKHDLMNTPEMMFVFVEAIKTRLAYLSHERQANKTMVELLSIMGKLVPEKHIYREPLVWRKEKRHKASLRTASLER